MKRGVATTGVATTVLIGLSSMLIPLYAFDALDLTKVEAFNGDFSTQIMLAFSKPCEFIMQQNKSNRHFSLFFKGSQLAPFERDEFLKKIAHLGIVRKAHLGRVLSPSAGVQLDLYFNPGNVYVKFLPLDNKSKYIIEFYSAQALEKLNSKISGPLLYAYNGKALPDVSGDVKKKAQNRKPRIVLDPGHGGESMGAQGLCGLVEKNVVLDVSYKVKGLLEQLGCSVFLTRKDDREVSLLERSEIASRSKADLFVSIHANSAGGSSDPQGIETFHLNAQPFMSNAQGGDCAFSSSLSVESLRTIMHDLVRKKDSLSYNLAQSIQNNLISVLHQKRFDAIDRGVKRACFNVLLRGNEPKALVEIGFITNPREASLLSVENYRRLIAQGICRGVIDFLSKRVVNEVSA